MEKFLNLILGTTDLPTYFAGLLFALIGLAFYYRSKVKKRNALSADTPYSFSLKFFLRDNLSELIFSILGIILLMRFSVEYAGVETTMIYSLGLGLVGPKVIDMLYEYQQGARN
jgi:hypothetical protein